MPQNAEINFDAARVSPRSAVSTGEDRLLLPQV